MPAKRVPPKTNNRRRAAGSRSRGLQSKRGFSWSKASLFIIPAVLVLGYVVFSSFAASAPTAPGTKTAPLCGNKGTKTTGPINTVIVIAEENKTWSSVGGVGFSASAMPFTHAVASQCAVFQQDTEVNTGDNSAQQYVGAWTGYDSSVTHVSNDCSPSSSCSTTVNNIFRAFRTAGIPHREYVEGATTGCAAGTLSPAKHIPDLYMWDASDRAACPLEVRPLTEMNWSNPPTGFTFITPNLCNDGHGDSGCSSSSITTVDQWLADPAHLPAVFNSTQYKAGKVLVELWWDEDHPKPNLFACATCKHVSIASDPHFSGESRLWLNLLGAPSTNLGQISTAVDIRSLIGTP